MPFSIRLIVCLLFVLAPSALVRAQSDSAPIEDSGLYRPLTAKQRLQWFATSTVGPESLAAGVFSAAISTATNSPEEYGPHWEGFGKRYGMRLTGVSTGNAMEAGLGALWGEDPRYFSSADRQFKGRVANIVKMTFAARRRDGRIAPAYARLIATPGNNFLSNTWRADSEATTGDAALRTMWGFLGRMGSNAFAEFWPDVKQHVLHKGR
jgi:hypothetical protein